MKKISIILLALTIISVANMTSPSEASAKRIDDDGAIWWSVPELLDYKKVVDEEINNTCGSDANCYQDLYFSKIENGDAEFRALEMLAEQQFVLTGVDPSKNTIKVLFFDEDMMLSRMGVKEQLSPENLYIGLFDYQIERIYNYGALIDDFARKAVPGAHEVYLWDIGSGTPADIIANQEVELKNSSNLPLSAFDRFGYGVFAGPFNAQGQLYYGSCFNDPDYREGEECHLMISPEKGTAFFVSQEKPVISSDSLTNETPIEVEEPNAKNSEFKDQDGQKNNDDQPSQDPQNSQNSQITPSKQNEQTQTEPMTPTQNAFKIKAPETGAVHSGGEDDVSDPFQIAPFTASGFALISFFVIFLAKKYKKGVDNTTGV